MNPLHKCASMLCCIFFFASSGCSAEYENMFGNVDDEGFENSTILTVINGVEGDCDNAELWRQARVRADGVEVSSLGFIEPGERYVELDYFAHANCARSFYGQYHTFERRHRYLMLVGGRGDLYDEMVYFEDITSNYSSPTNDTKLLLANASISTPLADITIRPAAGEAPHEPRHATLETMGRTWIGIVPGTAYDVTVTDLAMKNGPWSIRVDHEYDNAAYYMSYCRLAKRREPSHSELECEALWRILQ